MPQAEQNAREGEEDNGDTPAAFPEDLTLREMKASFKSYIGALTRLSNQVKVRAETFVAIKSPGSATQLNKSYNKFLAKCDLLHCAAHQLALEDEENSAAWMQAQDQLQPMQDTIERIYGDAQVQLGIGSPTPETGTFVPGAAKVRVRHDLKPWEISASAMPSEFLRWRRKYEQYYLGSDIGVTNLPGQQATISGCVDRELEQHLYNLINDATPVFTPEPNDDDVVSCMDIIADWIAERHPLDSRRMELFKLPQERGESMVQYSNRILVIADKCDLNNITQQEIMAMVFITHCRSPQFRNELRQHGVGVTWQFKRKEAQGWDRSQHCEEQSNEKAFTVKRNAGSTQNRSQARNQRPSNTSSKKDKAEAFFKGKCRRCGSTVHSLKDCKVAALSLIHI